MNCQPCFSEKGRWNEEKDYQLPPRFLAGHCKVRYDMLYNNTFDIMWCAGIIRISLEDQQWAHNCRDHHCTTRIFLQYRTLPVHVWVLKFLQIQTKIQLKPFHFCQKYCCAMYVLQWWASKALWHIEVCSFCTENDPKLHCADEHWHLVANWNYSSSFNRLSDAPTWVLYWCTWSLSLPCRTCRCPINHSCSGVRSSSVCRGWLFHPLNNVSRSEESRVKDVAHKRWTTLQVSRSPSSFREWRTSWYLLVTPTHICTCTVMDILERDKSFSSCHVQVFDFLIPPYSKI